MRNYAKLAVPALTVCLGLFGTNRVDAECPPSVWQLTAGQHIDVGDVIVTNDEENLYVTGALNFPEATFGQLHLWVGNDLLNVPATPGGTPIPGQFCSADGGACADATGLTQYTFTIPFADLNIVDVNEACGLSLYVVFHAEVNIDGEHETAFGGPNPINVDEPGRWWFYGVYTVCCEFGEPELPVCSTAFAKGGYVWTTDKKSNPESLPSLRLTKNRWGWAIKLAGTGTTSYPIYQGAGLNKTSNGTLVGTLTVNWDGTDVIVTYDLVDGADLEEVHIYAGDTAPTTIAPGQYGYLDSFEPNPQSYTATLPLSDTNGDGCVWLVAHSVVCR